MSTDDSEVPEKGMDIQPRCLQASETTVATSKEAVALTLNNGIDIHVPYIDPPDLPTNCET